MKQRLVLLLILFAILLLFALPALGQATFKHLAQPEFDFEDYRPDFDDPIQRPDERFDLAALRDQRNRARYNDSNAQYNLAAMEHLRGNYTVAARWYRAAALMGNPLAQHNLATLYYNGWGVQKNREQARRWFEKAAAQDVAAAQYQLGLMAYRAEHPNATPAAEADWYEKAALAGYPEAQYNLGVLYAKGEGRNQDKVRGLAWLLVAERAGVESVEAINRINDFRAKLSPDQQDRAQAMATQLERQVQTG